MNDKKLNGILLSICILTYNQPKEIRALLESLRSQITQEIMDEIEILVRDDSPDSETEKIVKEYSTKTPIDYFKGEKLGIDKAILFLTEKAKGKYIWWIGDDEVDKGGIERVLTTVKKFPNISFILVNFRNFNRNEAAFQFGNDRFFKDNNEVLGKAANVLGFISITILKREMALSGIEPSKKYIGSEFVNLYLIFHVLSQKGRIYFLSKPYIIDHLKEHGEDVFYRGFQVFGVNFFNIAQEFKDKFEGKSVRKMLAKNFSHIWRGALVNQARGQNVKIGFSSPIFKPICKLYWSFPEFWLALPFLIMPRFINRFFYKIYKLFFSHRKWRFGKK